MTLRKIESLTLFIMSLQLFSSREECFHCLHCLVKTHEVENLYFLWGLNNLFSAQVNNLVDKDLETPKLEGESGRTFDFIVSCLKHCLNQTVCAFSYLRRKCPQLEGLSYTLFPVG